MDVVVLSELLVFIKDSRAERMGMMLPGEI